MKHASRLKFVLSAVLVALIAATLFGIVRARQKSSGRQLLNRIAGVYKNCQSYQDSGTARLESKSFVKELRFTTSFVRPTRFRYEYLGNERMPDGREERYIVWRSGEELVSWSSIVPRLPSAAKSFSVAIAGATGVSAGAAHTIPALLFSKEEIKGHRLTDMTETTRLANAQLGGSECIRIQGRHATSNIVLWVDSATFLIRKIERESDRGPKTVVTYQPVVNAEIPQQTLDSTNPQIQ